MPVFSGVSVRLPSKSKEYTMQMQDKHSAITLLNRITSTV